MPPRHRCEACSLAQRFCDRARPKCGRCSSKSIDCVYELSDQHKFVDQNDWSADLSRRAALRARGRATRTPHGRKARELTGYTVTPTMQTTEDSVLLRFFARWAAGQTCLPPRQSVYLKLDPLSRSQDTLRSVVTSVAYADLAVEARHGEIANKSIQAYSIALHRLRAFVKAYDGSGSGPICNEVYVAILTLDSFELLFIGRPNLLGAHTHAIIQLLRRQLLSAPASSEIRALLQATAPRIHARLLLHSQPALIEGVQALASTLTHPFDIRMSQFIIDVEDLILKSEKHSALASSDLAPMIESASHLLEEMEKWLLTCDESGTKPIRLEPDFLCSGSWPLPVQRSTILVMDQHWAARNVVLFHMCKIKILEFLAKRFGDQSSCSLSEWISPVSGELPAEVTLHSIHYGLQKSSSTLLDLVPYIIGLVDELGEVRTSSPLKDLGLLIVQYPLWMLANGTYVPEDAKREASTLQAFFKRQRMLFGQVS